MTDRPPGEVGVDVVAAEADPGAPAEHGDQQRRGGWGRCPTRCGAATGRRRRGDERLDLDEQRPRALEDRRDDAARAPGRRARRGTRGPGRRPRPGRGRAISKTPTSSVDPYRFFVARSEAQPAGPVALDREHDVDEVLQRLRARPACRPWSRAPRARPGRPRPWRAPSAAASASRTWPTEPGRPVELLRRHGLDRVDDQQPGPGGARQLGDPADAGLGDDPDRARRRRPSVEPETRGPQPDLRRGLLAGRVQHARAVARRRPAATWSRSVDLPIPGSPPSSTTDPATSPPPRTRSSSPIPTGRRSSRVARRRHGTAGRARRPAGTTADAGARRGSSRTTVSTRVFHSPQVRHWPSQRGRRRRRTGRRTGSGRGPRGGCLAAARSGFDRGLRLGGLDGQAVAVGIERRPRSCRPGCTGRAAGAPRAGPRSGSGSSGAAAGRRTPAS